MARKRTTLVLDPATGKPLHDGVVYRGPAQYRARKLVDGQRFTKTFATGRSAARWLAEVQVDHDRGLFVDRSEAERHTLKRIIERYREEVLGEDSEKRGAEKERGHLKPDLDSRAGFRHREWQKCWRLIKPDQKCGAKLWWGECYIA
jgi:hypothetical protein